MEKTERLFKMAEEWKKIQTVKRFLNDLEENLKLRDQLNEAKL